MPLRLGRWLVGKVITAALSGALRATVRFLPQSCGWAIVIAAILVRLIGGRAGRGRFSGWATAAPTSSGVVAAIVFALLPAWARVGSVASMSVAAVGRESDPLGSGIFASAFVNRGSADALPTAWVPVCPSARCDPFRGQSRMRHEPPNSFMGR